jgi:hypothetical protein
MAFFLRAIKWVAVFRAMRWAVVFRGLRRLAILLVVRWFRRRRARSAAARG